MKDYNPVDVCHYCNDRMYEYLKQKIHEKIKQWDGDTCWECGNTVAEELKSLLEDNKK